MKKILLILTTFIIACNTNVSSVDEKNKSDGEILKSDKKSMIIITSDCDIIIPPPPPPRIS